MKDDVQIYDETIPLDWCKSLENLLLKADETSVVPWTYCSQTAPPLFENSNQRDSFQFVHNIFQNGSQKSEILKFYSLFFSFLPFGVGEINRIKCNLTTTQPNFTTENFTNIHLDCNVYDIKENPKYETYSMLFYINESDGDTLIFDEDGKNIIDRIPYKRSRVAVFPAKYPHAGQYPINHPDRLVMNNIIGGILPKNAVPGHNPGVKKNYFGNDVKSYN